MKQIAIYLTREEAEKAGDKLIDAGIDVHVDGDFAGDIILKVAEEDVERAEDVLEIQRPEPFHPCPKCGAGDPLYPGKWKTLSLIGYAIVIIVMAVAHVPSPVIACVLLVCFGALFLLHPRIKDFECRRCHTRFSR